MGGGKEVQIIEWKNKYLKRKKRKGPGSHLFLCTKKSSLHSVPRGESNCKLRNREHLLTLNSLLSVLLDDVRETPPMQTF